MRQPPKQPPNDMPGPNLAERKPLPAHLHTGLTRHIMRAREKKKQEMEADMAHERKRKEMELRKKREHENSLTLEQTKAEISKLEVKLEQLKKDKSNLFSQLKDVIHEEEESRRKNKYKERQQEIPVGGGGAYYTGGGSGSSGAPMPSINPTMFLQGTGHMGMYKPHAQQLHSGRQHTRRSPSPAPPPAGPGPSVPMYGQYGQGDSGAAGKFGYSQGSKQQGPPPPQSASQSHDGRSLGGSGGLHSTQPAPGLLGVYTGGQQQGGPGQPGGGMGGDKPGQGANRSMERGRYPF